MFDQALSDSGAGAEVFHYHKHQHLRTCYTTRWCLQIYAIDADFFKCTIHYITTCSGFRGTK
jgi:hypothetical protein